LIDLNTEVEVRKIKVGLNPNKIEINRAGNVFCSALWQFWYASSVIDGATNTTSINLGSGFAYQNIRTFGDISLSVHNYGGTGTSKVYNTATNTAESSSLLIWNSRSNNL
jgi:hypothetical protein